MLIVFMCKQHVTCKVEPDEVELHKRGKSQLAAYWRQSPISGNRDTLAHIQSTAQEPEEAQKGGTGLNHA